jgi:DNA-binding NtrC family response regulator
MSDEHFRLLISDVGLPQLDGREMVERARAHRPRLKVLFITGYAEHARMGSDWLGPGMKLLAKPFTMETLAQQVMQMIGNA